MTTYVREPAVAGRFYPGRRDELLREVRAYTPAAAEKITALGCIAPHAGYMYSGHVAGAVYSHLELPKSYVILCPNHTGMGEPLAIMTSGRWRTPLGEATVDNALGTALKERLDLLSEDVLAHHNEHALEVQLPFLQAEVGDFTFVPIVVGVSRFEVLEQLGQTIAETLGEQSRKTLVVASSDMNHYESDAVTRVKDHKALEKVLALDPAGLFDVVHREGISMCGYGPSVAMLTAAKQLGATTAQLIKYATSGDISGDRDMVVGYAGVAVS